MKIAITTSGGDAPGLNAVVYSATIAARRCGHEMVGIRKGFAGLLDRDEVVPLDEDVVEGIQRTGGTILGAQSSGRPFGGEKDGLAMLVAALRRHGIEGLIMAGGDGTMGIAHQIAQVGFVVVGVPKTIDRDVVGTYTTFGFDTAVATATEAIDRIHSTAESHSRILVVEVMGRDAGWIALYAGMGGGASAVALPEFPYDADVFARHIAQREAAGKSYHILVCAEGARPMGGDFARSERTGRLGGAGERIAAELERLTGKETRSISLGHMLRGGAPTARDRLLGLRFGSAAVSALNRGATDVMIGYDPPGFVEMPLSYVAGKNNLVSANSPELRTAANLGICFGI
jgi:ATP-dependent phosphofructokinase / diphosphate-dependent phosphofructokinase